ncbi:MAG: hypothetical protein U0235_26100 [Polyangiaceae bacterium]
MIKSRSEAHGSRVLSRREATTQLLVTLGGAFAAACGASSVTGAGASDGGSASTGSGDDGGAAATGSDAATTTVVDGSSWASGGTAAMTAKASYPNPFASAAATCTAMLSVTEGPCTEAQDQVRQDISEGFAGLPVRLALRVVDASCQPVSGATVKIWHTQKTGSYSGNTPNPGMCLKDQSDSAKHYFRGFQTADADGRVDFDTCLPGWYRGRTVHIHYTVGHNGKTFTSQLVFDQALVASIFASHPDYAAYGPPDTTNASDNVVGGKDLSTFVLDTQRMSDGAMLASKTLVVSV